MKRQLKLGFLFATMLLFGTTFLHSQNLTVEGSVGIGTTSPSSKLHVKGADPQLYIQDTETSSTNATSFLKFSESNNSGSPEASFRIGYNQRKFTIGFSSNDTGYNNILTALDDGGSRNVGIGTTNPTEKLEVSGNVKATKFIGDGSMLTGISSSLWSGNAVNNIYNEVAEVGIGVVTPKAKLHVSGGNSGVLSPKPGTVALFEDDNLSYISLIAPGPTGIVFGRDFNNDMGGIYFNPSSNGNGMSFHTGGDEQMYISVLGNVGIGTATAVAKLHIDGGTDVTDVSGGFLITGNLSGLNIGLDDNEIQARDNGAAATLNLQATGGNTVMNASMNANGGNVGIGTTNPQSNLHIKQTTGGDPRRGIRFERSDNTNYWTIHTDSSNDFNFRFNNSLKAYVDDNGGNYVQPSDKKLKKNITAMDEVLPGVLQLQPKWYNYIDNEAGASKSLGFIAQEVENIFPNFTFEKEGTKALAYDYFAVLSIKAIQELHTEIEGKDELIQSQNDKIEALAKENEDIKARLAKIEALLQGQSTINNTTISNSTTVLTDAKLEQNQPNPFNGSTVVRYFIPQDVKRAELRITDLTGKVIKSIAIQARGEGQTAFDATTLSSGNYQYSLILDGQLLDTKQMVLTKN